MDILTIIVPCYNEEIALPIFCREILKVADGLKNIDIEVLFINDGSKDSTLDIIKAFAEVDKRIKYISFSRNFGKEASILAGLKLGCIGEGEYFVIMDADLQDPPSLLPDMLGLIRNEGYDSVATRRVSRVGEPPIRSFFARLFYKIINKISDTNIVDGARDYRMMSRQMVDSILELSEYHRFSKGIFGWVGYNTKWLEYENIERVAGNTKWSFKKLFFYGIEGIVAFTTVPLRIASIFGSLLFSVSILLIIIVVARKILFGDPVAGWASLMCVLLFMSGIQFMFMGVLGEYLAKTYMEVKHRPNYFIKETNITNTNIRSKEYELV